MNKHWVTQDEARLLPHLPCSSIQSSLSILDRACHEIVPIRVLTSNECAWSKLVSQYDLIPPGIMPQHRDGIAALHHLPGEPSHPAPMFLYFEFITIYVQKPCVQECSAADSRC